MHNKISQVSLSQQFLEQKKLPCNARMRVRLSNNPVECDCDLLAKLEFLEKNKDNGFNVIGFDNFSCIIRDLRSENKNPVNVTELNRTAFTCELNYHDSAFNGICGINGECNCKIRPHDDTLIVNCSNRNLTEVPEINWNVNVANIELNLRNNRIKAIPKLQGIGFAKVRLLDLSNNLITALGKNILYSNIKVTF